MVELEPVVIEAVRTVMGPDIPSLLGRDLDQARGTEPRGEVTELAETEVAETEAAGTEDDS